MENKNQLTFAGSENQTQPVRAKKETLYQEKIRVARESRSVLRQIDRLEKEIASDRKKLEKKEAKLAALVARL